MHNALIHRVDAPSFGWAALAATPTVLSCRLIAVGEDVQLRFDQGDAVAVPDGRAFDLVGVDLSRLQISGTGAVVVAGGTWRPGIAPRL